MSRTPTHILGLPEAILWLLARLVRIGFVWAHDAPHGSRGQSTQSTGAMKPAASLCRINQQYLCLITMTPAYHWPRQPSYPK
jgi:hypothetical protein